MEYKSQLNISLPTELLKRLDERRGTDTRSKFIEKVVEVYLEEHEAPQ